jgi:hypothetical protein
VAFEIAPDAELAMALLSEGSASIQLTRSPQPGPDPDRREDVAALEAAATEALPAGAWQVDGSDPAGAFVWVHLGGVPDRTRQALFRSLAAAIERTGRHGRLVVHDGVPPFLRQAFSADTGLPAGWPEDVPLPPGAVVTSARCHDGMLEVDVDGPGLPQFYRGALIAAGYEPTGPGMFVKPGVSVKVGRGRVAVRLTQTSS